MKTRNLQASLLSCAVFVSIAFAGGIAAAQNSLTTPAGTTAAPLSAGVPEIIELAQANVNDATIVNYIQNSGISYSLRADEVVYLKQQGVSDTVVNAMLN